MRLENETVATGLPPDIRLISWGTSRRDPRGWLVSTPPRRIGRYQLVAELGRGGAGQVWEAVLLGPRGFQKPVALKILHAHVADDSPQYHSLVHEARLGALLSHPNVVSIYELAQTDDGVLYVAMELVHGPTVLDMLRAHPFDAPSILDVGIQSAEALQHVHALRIGESRSGLVHRDVKPSNLLVDGGGLVKLTDLGVARLTGANEAAAYIAGTPGYMSPEQMEGKEDHRTDLFSLGATLYVLAAGKRPFGSGPPALRRTVLVERSLSDPAFMAPVDAKVPGLGSVLKRCLRFDPEARYATAGDLVDALRMLRAQHEGAGIRAAARRAIRPDGAMASQPLLTDMPTAERPEPTLPDPVDVFVGRNDALRRLKKDLTEAGLVVVTGPAGCGKSRLALELARRLERQGQSAWFVPLGDVDGAPEWMSRLAAAIDVPLGEGDHAGRLGHSLRALGNAVLVLDDVDGVVQSVADAATLWRELAPRVQLILTSRRVPRGDGLRRHPVSGLALDDAIALFYTRAPQAPPPSARDEVRELVRRVDGLPLAVELIAARTRHVGLDQIAARLDYRLFSAEGTGGRRSLGAVLEASIEHLEPTAKAALGQLSVCVEGFTLEAADGILDLGGDEVAPWALDVVERLAEESLLTIDPETGRVRMLHTVRAFAKEALTATQRSAAQRRHASYFAQLGSPSAVDALHRTGGHERLQALAAERGNLASALGRSLAMKDPDLAEGCAIALWEVLQVLGPLSTAWELLEKVVDSLGDATSARLLAAAGQAATLFSGLATAEPLLLRAIDRGRDTGDGISRANAEGCLGYLHRDAGNPDKAQRYLEASLLGHKVEGNRWGEGMALYRLGLLRYHQSQLVEARGLTEGAVRAFREVGDRRQEGTALHSSALMISELGQHEEALRRGESALAIHREQHNRHAEAVALGNQGIMLRRIGRLSEAKGFYQAALQANRAVGNRRLEGAILGNLGTLHVALEDYKDARAYYEQAIEAHRDVGNRHYEGIVLGNFGELLHRMGEDREARVRLEVAVGIAAAVKDRTMEGTFLAVLGQVLEALGDTVGADTSFDAAELVLDGVKDPTSLAKVLLYRAEVLVGRGWGVMALGQIARADELTTGVSDASEVRMRVRSLRARARD